MSKVVLIKEKETAERKPMIEVETAWFSEGSQLKYVKNLLLCVPFEAESLVRRELANKLAGYKQQDIKKNKLDGEKFITFEELIELLVVSQMRCKYCMKQMFILYEKQREKVQWTLDRIDNDEGHNKDNVITACLDCNLRRRRLDADKFKFTKQMNLVKIDD
jgi:alkylhydroperoxidase family enzyme